MKTKDLVESMVIAGQFSNTQSFVNPFSDRVALSHMAHKTRVSTHLLLNQGCQRKVVEQVGEGLPDVGIAILSQALVVEPIHLSDLARFVVSTKNGDAVLIAHFESDKEGHSLDGIVSTIDVVAHKEIVGIRRVAADAEQLHQVVKLAVDITANGNRAADRLHVGFFHQDLASL